MIPGISAETGELLASILEGAQDAWFVYEAVPDAAGGTGDFRLVRVNEVGLRLVEQHRSNMEGRLLSTVFPRDEDGGVFQRCIQVFETGIPLEETFRLRGEVVERWVRHRVVAVPGGIAITSRDVEDDRRRQAVYRTILDALPGAVVAAFDRQGRWTLSGGELAEALGVAAAVGRTPEEVLPPQAAARTRRLVARALAGESVSLSARTDDGRWLDHRLVPLVDPGHTAPVGAVAFGVDVTARVEAEAELRMWTRAVAAAEQAVLVLDAEPSGGRVRMASPAFEAVTGYRPEELVGQSWGFLEGPATETRVAGRIRAAIRAGQAARAEVRLHRADGSPFRAEVSVAPMDGEAGKVALVLRDVSAEHALREESERGRRLTALGRMAGGMAHDVRNLLTGISMLAELWVDDPDVPGELRADLKQIRELVSRGGSLMGQLLEFASNEMVLPEPVDLRAEVGRVEALLRRTLRDDISLAVRLPSEPVWILSGAGQVDQVLVNLCINAQDAQPEGGSISVALVVEPERGEVELRVRDTGCGIPASARDRIFEPFFTTRAERGGTGLGLASVYGIVRQWGGRIDVDSEPGLGTTFTVTLPVIESPEEVEPEGDPPPSAEALRVLLAEDDPSVRRALQRIFHAQGWSVAEASGGRAAAALWDAADRAFDVVVSDVLMPDGTGVELVHHLRNAGASVPVVLVSGYAPRSVPGMDRILDPGRTDARVSFVAKPFALPELIQRVRDAVNPGQLV